MYRVLLTAALACSGVFAQAPPAAAKAKPAPREVPPARIREFKADKTSLEPGQSAMLSWAVENPTATAISGLGNVSPVGNRRVTPQATTTYTLTVRGPNGEFTQSVTVNVAGTAAVSAASVDAPKAVPQLNGKPDLSGVYNSSSFSQMFGGRTTRGQNDPFTGKLKPGAETFKVTRGPEDTGLFSDCMPTGVPEAYFVPYPWQITQGRDAIVIMYEYPHLFRAIPIYPSKELAIHPEDPDPTWMGHSVAWWEGDTLVVDVVGFNDKTELPGGFRHTESLHVVERFTRTGFEDLDYVATMEDPNVFVEPWTIRRGFPLRPDVQTVSEFVCENNRNYKEFFEKK